MKCMALFSLVIVTGFAIALAGCGTPATGPVNSNTPAPSDGDGGHDHAEHVQSDMDKMKAELAKLSPEDAASAEEQHFCPVSGEMLGSMGAPKKIDVDGRLVWICCDDCKDKLLGSPDEYLAKLKKK